VAVHRPDRTGWSRPLCGGALRFYTLGTSRNTLRLPACARLDVRADRTFSVAGKRLTAFVEVVNLLNRTNVRNVPFRSIGSVASST